MRLDADVERQKDKLNALQPSICRYGILLALIFAMLLGGVIVVSKESEETESWYLANRVGKYTWVPMKNR